MASRLHELGRSRTLALGVVGGALAYAFFLVDLGWIPHDDGMLAQAASRVRDGELPHRDFDDPYTGGQALLHALAFELLGERLLTLRLVLFAALAATVPVVWAVARRFAGRAAAASATLLAVAWSVPAHPMAMPSWYNLFLAIAATGALLRFHDTRHERWLLAAGACAGVSLLVKVVGLYLVAAAFLWLVFLDQEEATLPPRSPAATRPLHPDGHRILVSAGLLAFLAALAVLLRGALAPSTLLWFYLPPATLAGLLLHREWTRPPRAGQAARTRTLVRRGLLLSAGAAVPVAAFLVPYAASGALGALVEGTLVAPGRRLGTFLKLPPPAVSALPLLAVAALVLAAARHPRADPWVAAGLGAVLAVVVAAAGAEPALYRAGWTLLHPLVPVVVLLGVARLAAHRLVTSGEAGAGHEPAGSPAPAERFLLLAVTAMVSLVGFPTYIAHYVFYSAPLVVLSALAVAAPLRRAPRATLAVLLAFHLAFAGLWVHGAEVWQMGRRYNAHGPAVRLALERGGIRVTPGEKEVYERLIGALDQVGAGPYLWASPDAPEVYFLSGLENPTRTFYDFLDEDFYRDPAGRRGRIRELLERHQVPAVVVKRTPTLVSPPLSPALRDMLVARYPRVAEIGPFLLFVRGEEGG